jgi:hypothetical protein
MLELSTIGNDSSAEFGSLKSKFPLGELVYFFFSNIEDCDLSCYNSSERSALALFKDRISSLFYLIED